MRNLTVVGDDDQSIYGFRGADPRGFRLLAAALEESGGGVMRQVALENNYRRYENDGYYQVCPIGGPKSTLSPQLATVWKLPVLTTVWKRVHKWPVTPWPKPVELSFQFFPTHPTQLNK